jgi:CrcB protein
VLAPRDTFSDVTRVRLRDDAIDPELSPGVGRPSLVDVAAAFFGGTLGTLARYGFDRAWPEGDGAVPHTTNVINTVGALLIGIVATLLTRRYLERSAVRALLVTGLIGGWTTMSTLAVADVRLTSTSGMVSSSIAMALSFALGVAAAAGGSRWASRLLSRKDSCR